MVVPRFKGQKTSGDDGQYSFDKAIWTCMLMGWWNQGAKKICANGILTKPILKYILIRMSLLFVNLPCDGWARAILQTDNRPCLMRSFITYTTTQTSLRCSEVLCAMVHTEHLSGDVGLASKLPWPGNRWTTHLWQTHTASPATSPAINSLHSVPPGPTPIRIFVGDMHAGSIYSASILIMIEETNFSLQTPWSDTGEKTRVHSSISALDGGTWPSSHLDNHRVTD